jgi:UDPglucose--hexose-1-phosphate uridylyltransferase
MQELRSERLGAGVVKHATRLADGRELIYYDDAGTALGPHRDVDTRTLDPRPDTATMRRDVLTGDWISVAAARQDRAFLPPAELDPLAPQTPANPSEIPSNYDVAVFENRSPAFGPALAGVHRSDPAGVYAALAGVRSGGPVAENTALADAHGCAATADAPRGLRDLEAPGLGRTRTAVGRCEVVCFSPEHEGSFGTQTVTRARTVIEAWADRTAALSALPGVEQVFPFENRGEAIGVTLGHPHGQIYAYPYVTPRTQRLLEAIDREGADLFARILAFEQQAERVVLSGEHWTAFVPFAARWPLEVHLMPHRQIADLAETTGAERDELAPLYLQLLRGVDAMYETLPTPSPHADGSLEPLGRVGPTPYIAAWHQAPVRVGREAVRLRLELTSPRRAADKMKFLAGSEAAMGAWIGDIPPEVAAARLREAMRTIAEPEREHSREETPEGGL